MTRNRNFFTLPRQGNGRDHAGYGLSSRPVAENVRDPWMRATLFGAAMIAAYFVWQFLR